MPQENDTPPAPNAPSRFRAMLRAFAHRNFRLFFSGQCISLLGTWIQGVALTWTVYQLTRSPFLVGLASFAGQLPLFLLTPFAGVWVDRVHRHRLLLLTQSLAMAQAAVLATLAYAGRLDVWGIVALNVLGGIIAAADMPTRQAFIVDMVGHGPDLPNAVALNSFTVNGSRMIGPAVAGLMLTAWSASFCFLLNAVSYIAVLSALLVMRLPAPELRQRPKESRVFHELAEGVRYAWGFPPIRAILLLIIVTSLLGSSLMVLMPVFAREIFRGGPHTYGYLMTMQGVGALSTGVYLATRRSVLGAGRRIAAGAMLFSISLIFFGTIRWLPLAFGAMALAGLGLIMQMALSNTVIQTLVDNDKRGRVMSLFTVSFMGMAPFGSLLTGALANRVGAPLTTTVCGFICLAASLLFASQLPALRRHAAPIYIRKGILPGEEIGPVQIAEGLEKAADFSTPPED